MAVLRKKILSNGYVWIVDCTYQGKRFRISTGTPSYKIAKRVLGDIQGKIASNKFGFNSEKQKQTTLKRFFEEYFNLVQDQKAKSTIDLEKTYTKRFLDIIKDHGLRSIDYNIVNKWKAVFCKEVSPATVNIAIRTLRSIFNSALKMGYIEENPFDDLTKMKVQERRLFFKFEELTKVFREIEKEIKQPNITQKVKNFRKRFKLYIEFLLETGLRRGEALALRKENIDYDRNVIYIEKTKTAIMRNVPMTKRAKEILTEIGDDLFQKLNEHDVTCKFKYYLKKVGLNDFKLHSLRHTFGCRLHAAGVDIYTISKLMGHTDIKTTMIYAKVGMETLQSAVDKLDDNKKNLVLRDTIV
jgi:integrase